jgi:hypothetical protein
VSDNRASAEAAFSELGQGVIDKRSTADNVMQQGSAGTLRKKQPIRSPAKKQSPRSSRCCGGFALLKRLGSGWQYPVALRRKGFGRVVEQKTGNETRHESYSVVASLSRIFTFYL